MGTAAQEGDQPFAIKVGDVVLDRYRVVEQIAAGGHSVVFRGEDERLARPVCIKVFSGFGGKSGVGRTSYEHFVQEAFALSRLTHPNTLRIYDFGHVPGDDAGMPLQVCEYMNGGTLSNVVREKGKQSVEETVRVMTAMCSALAEAHALGIVHRDIKPQNILFGAVGTDKLPKLADFGIAKWSVETPSETDKSNNVRAEDTAMVAGQKLAMYSPSWAAPEQLAGQPVSAATDIYSLAVVAVYMLSGKAIFAEEDVYAGYKKRRQASELVRDTLKPLSVPPSVVDVLAKALAFEPKKRYANVEAFTNELGHAIATEERNSRPLSAQFAAQFGAEPATIPASPRHSATGQFGVSTSADTQPGDAPPPAPSLPPTSPSVPPSPQPPTPIAIPIEAAPSWRFPPPITQAPWIATVPPASGTTRVLPLTDGPQPAGDRRVHFVKMGASGQADLVSSENAKVRITLLHGPMGMVIHVKGLTCFVAHPGGRPSAAIQLHHPSDVALVTPRAQAVGYLRIATGTLDGTQHVFALNPELVAVATEDCTDPILFDFGPGSDAYFVYTRGRTVSKSNRRG
ncbi:MAG: serine/threonine protein kinase [Kofleriaceae bacterium]